MNIFVFLISYGIIVLPHIDGYNVAIKVIISGTIVVYSGIAIL